MQFSITITGDEAELTPAVKALVAALAQGNATVEVEKPAKPPRTTKTSKADKPETVEEPETKSDSEAEDVSADAESEDDVEEISDVDLRAAASKVAKAGKQAEIKALLSEFGVPNITALPQADRAKFLKRLDKL